MSMMETHRPGVTRSLPTTISHPTNTQQPPYPPTTAGVGGQPSISIDVPICAVFILLYAGAAAGHQTLYQLNRRKGHNFIISLPLFGFCMARILTCALRMAWATHLTNVSLAIASNIFVNAGILIVYVVNVVFLQRILRAVWPELGWHDIGRTIARTLYALVALALILVIVFVVLSFYTLDMSLLLKIRDIQLAALTYLTVFAALPLILLPLTFFRSSNAQNFGEGSMTAKILILLVSAAICSTEQGFRAGTIWEKPRPASDPAWYDSRAAFYVFNFTIEIVVIYFLLLTRVDKRFHVPDGSSKRKHYGTEEEPKLEADGSSV